MTTRMLDEISLQRTFLNQHIPTREFLFVIVKIHRYVNLYFKHINVINRCIQAIYHDAIYFIYSVTLLLCAKWKFENIDTRILKTHCFP